MGGFFVLEPEVPGGLGSATRGDFSVHPPRIEYLSYEMACVPTDDLVASFPVFLASQRLSEKWTAMGATGVSLGTVRVTPGDQFALLSSGRIPAGTPIKDVIPKFVWLKVAGRAGQDDFGLEDLSLVVSGRVLDVLLDYGLSLTHVSRFLPGGNLIEASGHYELGPRPISSFGRFERSDFTPAADGNGYADPNDGWPDDDVLIYQDRLMLSDRLSQALQLVGATGWTYEKVPVPAFEHREFYDPEFTGNEEEWNAIFQHHHNFSVTGNAGSDDWGCKGEKLIISRRVLDLLLVHGLRFSSIRRV